VVAKSMQLGEPCNTSISVMCVEVHKLNSVPKRGVVRATAKGAEHFALPLAKRLHVSAKHT
jgi:hypothetical protein